MQKPARDIAAAAQGGGARASRKSNMTIGHDADADVRRQHGRREIAARP